MGLALVSIGTGGIKPCVSTFGGDQFKESQVPRWCLGGPEWDVDDSLVVVG